MCALYIRNNASFTLPKVKVYKKSIWFFQRRVGRA